MPDAKYADEETASAYSGAPDYPQVMRTTLLEMHRQVGDLEIGNGLATRGMLIRHLVMPGLESESFAILDFIAGEISRNSYVNIMGQYRPAYKAHEHPDINRPVSNAEYERVRAYARQLGLRLSD